jgi:hypothetical protein
MVIPVYLCTFGLRLAAMNRGANATVNERREFTFMEIINRALMNPAAAATHQQPSWQREAVGMTDENDDTAEWTARVVTALLILSPFLAALCYFLALAQGASEQASAVIGLAGFAMCLAAAGLNWLRGAQATRDLWWITVILRLLGS